MVKKIGDKILLKNAAEESDDGFDL